MEFYLSWIRIFFSHAVAKIESLGILSSDLLFRSATDHKASTTMSIVDSLSLPAETGLNQLVDAVRNDPGLLTGRISSLDRENGARAASAMNRILNEAILATGSGVDGIFTVDKVKELNYYIRANYKELWAELHGDDENCSETGFHLVQNDGALLQYRGANLINTVADGIYHLGFEIIDDTLLNEDGAPNASVGQIAEWLTQFYTDHSTTGTGLDKITDLVMADRGLSQSISDAEIVAGADAANRMNNIINEAITSSGVASDSVITADDVSVINEFIRERYNTEWALLHGDDECGSETGFHLVQNDGASTRMFGKNFVNTVADGIYHLGFEIRGNTVLNEDGNPNANLGYLASWLQYFYVDQSTTGTGLDLLTDSVKSNPGLAVNTAAADINAGATAADAMNQIIVDTIKETGVAEDSIISPDDIRTINTSIRQFDLDEWTRLHGDDEECEETGFHLVQNDGANVTFRGDNLINTVADGIYHLGFAIEDDTVLNEDGNPNATLSDLATWLNYFYLGKEIVYGSNDAETIKGLNHAEAVYAEGGDDCVYTDAGDDLLMGGAGNDALYGQDGNDTLNGEAGNDYLSGGSGNDSLLDDSGNNKLYGGDGNDQLTTGTGNDTLNGDSGNDTLHSGSGHDLIYGGKGLDLLVAGDGDDTLYGQDGNDTLNGEAGNDYLSGGSGDDSLMDDFGHNKLSGGDGNDQLNTGTGNDTLSGDSGNDTLYGNAGDDLLHGGSGADLMIGGSGQDTLNGNDDSDILVDGFGADLFSGGKGNDLLVSVRDSSDDTLSGGSGADIFYFIPEEEHSIGHDAIKDFSLVQGDQIWIGGNNVSVQLHYLDSNGNNKNDATEISLSSETGQSLGSIIVYGNLLIQNNVQLTGLVSYENAQIPENALF